MSFDFSCPRCSIHIDGILEEKHSHNLDEVIIKCRNCQESLIPCEICNTFFSLKEKDDNDLFSDLEDDVENRFCENCGWCHLIGPVSLRKYFNFSRHAYHLPYDLVQYLQRKINQRLYIRLKRSEFQRINVACASPRGSDENENDLERKKLEFDYVRKQLDVIEDLSLQTTLEYSFSFHRYFHSFTKSHFKILHSLYSDEKDFIPFALIKEFLSEKNSLSKLKKKYHLHKLAREGLENSRSRSVRNDLQLKTIFNSQCITMKEEWRKRSEKYMRLLCTLSTKVLVDLINKMNKQCRWERGISSEEESSGLDDDEEEEDEEGKKAKKEEDDDDFYLFGEEVKQDNRLTAGKISLLHRYNMIKRLYRCVACVIF